MRKIYIDKLTFILCILSIFLLSSNKINAQVNRTKTDSLRQAKQRKEYEKAIQDFNFYSNLSESEKTKILKSFIVKLNGCWISELGIEEFLLSDTTFIGSYLSKIFYSPAPLTRLDIVNGNLKLISSDSLGKVIRQGNIKINKSELIFVDDKDKGFYKSRRLERCPN